MADMILFSMGVLIFLQALAILVQVGAQKAAQEQRQIMMGMMSLTLKALNEASQANQAILSALEVIVPILKADHDRKEHVHQHFAGVTRGMGIELLRQRLAIRGENSRDDAASTDSAASGDGETP